MYKANNIYIRPQKINLKNILFITAIIIFTALSTQAQNVYSVDAEYKANVKVFVVDAEYKADLLVYKVDAEYKAAGNGGKWFFTDAEYKAKKNVFFVDAEYKSDLKIYFVDAEYKASWKNSAKKQLMY